MNKKGATNIEFVLAFILFAGFVTTAIYFFNPLRTTGVPDSTKNYIVNELIGNISVGLDSYSIAITPAAGTNEKIAVKIEGIEPNKKARAENYYGKQLDATRAGNIVYVDRGKEVFVSIEFCEDFTEKPTSETVWNANYYKIASSNSDVVISESRIVDLEESYNSNYAELKKKLGVPGNVDFSFTVTMRDGSKISTEKNIPVRAEVFSENALKEILRTDGSSEFGEITILVW